MYPQSKPNGKSERGVMNKNQENLTPAGYTVGVMMTAIAVICFFINPYLGMVIGFWAWLIYKIMRKQFSTPDKPSDNETVNSSTAQFIETIIREQGSEKMDPYDYSSHRIRRGSLPTHVHDILDEMQITTWLQLSLLNEKELLYEKCFGREALTNLKAELVKRGLTFAGSKPEL